MRKTRLKPSKRTRKRRAAVKQLDEQARLAVFERDGYRCVRCGRADGIQWCHVFSRRHKSLRWQLDNAITMDAGCHMWWHHEPAIAIPWFKEKWPERYEHILALYNEGGRVNPLELAAMA